MIMATLRFLPLTLLAVCASASAAGHGAPPSQASLCEQARGWGEAATSSAHQIPALVNEDASGRSYRFDLAGRGGLRALDASCGFGSYAECTFRAVASDGAAYQFSDLSSFGLWEMNGHLYLLYRIVSPKDDAAAAKRRVVRVDNPPIRVCNEIGDYSDLM
jgi:hypothetical protein